jgi:hypothetical protein
MRGLAVVLALALSAAAQAQLYKWVDSEGRIHYTDKPPPAGASGEKKLTVPKSPTAPVAAPAEEGQAAGPKSYAEKEMEYRKRKAEEEQSRQRAQAEEQENQQRCQSARQQLRTHEEAGRIYSMDDKGERVYVDDETRRRNIEQAQQDIAKYCR